MFENPNNVGRRLRAIALDYGYQTATGDPIAKGTLGAGIEYDWTDDAFTRNAAANYQRAITLPAGQPGNGHVFPLSISEANRYFTGNTGTGGRQATNLAGTSTGWWLRSPGSSTTVPVAEVAHAGGSIGFSAGNATTWGFRPALWVRIEQ